MVYFICLRCSAIFLKNDDHRGYTITGCASSSHHLVLFCVALKDRRAWEGISDAKHPPKVLCCVVLKDAKHPKIVANLCPLKTANSIPSVRPPHPSPVSPTHLGHPHSMSVLHGQQRKAVIGRCIEQDICPATVYPLVLNAAFVSSFCCLVLCFYCPSANRPI